MVAIVTSDTARLLDSPCNHFSSQSVAICIHEPPPSINKLPYCAWCYHLSPTSIDIPTSIFTRMHAPDLASARRFFIDFVSAQHLWANNSPSQLPTGFRIFFLCLDGPHFFSFTTIDVENSDQTHFGLSVII